MTYHQSPDPEGEQRARDLAVEKHDREASEFDKEYRTLAVEGYLATAFLLGREKIDRILYRELERCGTGARVLDAGCGTGSQLAEIAGRGFDVVGLEPAIEMRRIAIEANPGVEIGSGSITAMPFPDASFDVVIALEVLRYLPETDNDLAWKEMLRVLRPGGTLIFNLGKRNMPFEAAADALLAENFENVKKRPYGAFSANQTRLSPILAVLMYLLPPMRLLGGARKVFYVCHGAR